MPDPPSVDDAIDRYAELICARAEECGCRHVDLATCFVDLHDELAMVWDDGLAAGLVYDETCMADLLAFRDGLGCAIEGESVCARAECSVFHGDVPEGGACTRTELGAGDDCDSGLFCDGDGICRVDTDVPTVGLGEPCFDDITVELLALCERGLACDYFGTNTCYDAPAIGEPCETNDCEAGSWCDVDDDDGPLCKPQRGADEPCVDHRQCASSECTPRGTCGAEEALICALAT